MARERWVYSAAERKELWERWKRRQPEPSSDEIASAACSHEYYRAAA